MDTLGMPSTLSSQPVTTTMKSSQFQPSRRYAHFSAPSAKPSATILSADSAVKMSRKGSCAAAMASLRHEPAPTAGSLLRGACTE
jgi:hypothetical protein